MLIRGYEIWTPLPANRMVDISLVEALKRQAINFFASQTRFVDYTAILWLNQYPVVDTYPREINGGGVLGVHLGTRYEDACGSGAAEQILGTTDQPIDSLRIARPGDPAS